MNLPLPLPKSSLCHQGHRFIDRFIVKKTAGLRVSMHSCGFMINSAA